MNSDRRVHSSFSTFLTLPPPFPLFLFSFLSLLSLFYSRHIFLSIFIPPPLSLSLSSLSLVLSLNNISPSSFFPPFKIFLSFSHYLSLFISLYIYFFLSTFLLSPKHFSTSVFLPHSHTHFLSPGVYPTTSFFILSSFFLTHSHLSLSFSPPLSLSLLPSLSLWSFRSKFFHISFYFYPHVGRSVGLTVCFFFLFFLQSTKTKERKENKWTLLNATTPPSFSFFSLSLPTLSSLSLFHINGVFFTVRRFALEFRQTIVLDCYWFVDRIAKQGLNQVGWTKSDRELGVGKKGHGVGLTKLGACGRKWNWKYGLVI